MSRPSVIEVENLTKNYGPHLAVDALNFSVQKGEVVGFLGPNGAGKTTTMKIITGFMAASSGFARIAGYDVFENPLEVKRRIGYLPETPPVYGDMSVDGYLRFVAEIKGVERSRIKSLVDRSIEKTDLGSVRKRVIQNLSKGFRQRVGISQAIVSDPEVLILDEPTVGLDPRQVAEVRSLIKDLAGQHTIILSTHILPEVQASCDRIIIINKGRIVTEDSVDHVTHVRPGSARVRLRTLVTPSEDLRSRFTGLPGVLKVRIDNGVFDIETDGRNETLVLLSELAVSSRSGLIEIRQEAVNLEDVFLKLTTSEETQS